MSEIEIAELRATAAGLFGVVHALVGMLPRYLPEGEAFRSEMLRVLDNHVMQRDGPVDAVVFALIAKGLRGE